MLKNIKIGARLSMGFGVILILMFILGIFAINRLQSAHTSQQALVHDKWFKALVINKLHKYNDQMAASFVSFFLTSDPTIRDKEIARINSTQKIIDKQLELLNEKVTGDEGKRLFAKVVVSRDTYRLQQNIALALTRTGTREQIMTHLLGDFARAQTAYFEAVNSLAEIQDNQVSRLVESAESSYQLSLLLIPLMLFGITIMGAVIAWFITRSITKPVAACVAAANRIAHGDTTVTLDVTAKDETGVLQASMAQMITSIKALINEAETLTHAAVAGRLAARADVTVHEGDFQHIIAGFNDTLDAVIGPLSVAAYYVDQIAKGDIPPKITDDYSGDFNAIKENLNNCIDIMNNLLNETSGVLAATADSRLDERANPDLFVGDWKQLVVGVNNIVTEIVNPLRRTTELLNQEVSARCRAQEQLENKQLQLEDLNSQLEKRVAVEVEINQQRFQALMQSEKMASIGLLAAGVSHEINNPMAFVTGNLRTLTQYFDQIVQYDNFIQEHRQRQSLPIEELFDNVRKTLEIDDILIDGADLITESLDGAKRVSKIVKDLRTFSRIDKMEIESVELISCLESALNICFNELKYVANIRKDYEPGPKILCHPGQMNQVFMNLLVNAGQAIEPPGEIYIRNWHDDEFVYVSVSDTGKGISEQNMQRLFEPFFTTKEVGKGTGLGLSVSYEIVKKHHGEIKAVSEVGVGTCFTVRIPRNGMVMSDENLAEVV